MDWIHDIALLYFHPLPVHSIHLHRRRSPAMSFFGFDAVLPERRNDGAAEEDIAVYTWGTEAYDDLGGQLIEGGDEANDETFGDMPISTSL